MWPEDFEADEAAHQLDSASMAKTGYDDVNLIQHRVRTRVYFTSEAHLHSLVNVVAHGDGGLRSTHITSVPGYVWSPTSSPRGIRGAKGPKSVPSGTPLSMSMSKPRKRSRRPGGSKPQDAANPGSSAAATGSSASKRSPGSAFSSVKRGTGASSGAGAAQDKGRGSSGSRGLLTERGRQYLERVPELDYCSHVVFLLYERTNEPVGSPRRHRCEIRLSPGASYSPLDGKVRAPPTSLTKPIRMQSSKSSAKRLQRRFATDSPSFAGASSSSNGFDAAVGSLSGATSPLALPGAAAPARRSEGESPVDPTAGKELSAGGTAPSLASKRTRSQSARNLETLGGLEHREDDRPEAGVLAASSADTGPATSHGTSSTSVHDHGTARPLTDGTGGSSRRMAPRQAAGAWSHDRVTYPVTEAEQAGNQNGVVLAPTPRASAAELKSGCLPVCGMVVLSDDCPLGVVEDALAAAIMAPGAPDPREMRHTPAGERLRKANLRTPSLNMAAVAASSSDGAGGAASKG